MEQDSTQPSDGVPLGELVTLRAVLDAMPVFMVAVEGPELRVVAVTASVRALAERSEWLGVPLAEVYPELAVQGVLELYAEVYRTGQPFSVPEWRLELAGPGGGGVAELVVHWTSVPWRRPDGSIRGVIGVAHDVTEQVRARERAEEQAVESGRRYERARDVVSELQQALLPTAVPVLPRVDIAARYLVAGTEQSAGGDWFDVRPLADGRVGLAVGDVVGHGVAAAAVMSQLRAVLGDALETTSGPAAAVARLERFAESLPGARSATVVVAVVDPAAGTLEYLTRGHPAPVLIDASGTGRQLLGSGGGPLGGDGGGPAQRTQLGDGDVVVLFSDGLVERADRSYTAGLDELTRLAEAATVGQLWPTGTSPSAVERICTDAVELLTRRGFADDVTVLATSLQAPVPPLRTQVHASADELPRLRAQLREWLSALRPDPADQLALELAVGEAVDNAVEHGFHYVSTGTVVVALQLSEDGRVHVRIDDDGIWRPPASARSDRGRGLTLVGSLGEDLIVDGQPTGTTVTFFRRLSRPVSTAPTRAASPAALPSGDGGFDTLVVGEPPVLRVRGPVDALAAERFRAELAGLSRGGSAR
jgi:serine phosphatase RsbU (regulator of sigma subunit)/anti-sigma regulatory factor (Ser/Thr protein kinase)